ncbi:MAG: SCO1664 family protein [Actinomycetota bacterium]|nr:SCO1664 family protein [Actinomycetota bacterium]
MSVLDLSTGEIEVIGLIQDASNYTFLAELDLGANKILVIYKPRRGEAPLWDFPDGTLCLREVAAYKVAQMMGWDFIPQSIIREGPMGLGLVQEFMEHDLSATAFDLIDSHRLALKQMALFDIICNNADRKAGHVLLDPTSKIWGVDHGICFHEVPKLRTVLWDFVGEPFEKDDIDAVAGLCARFDAEVVAGLRDLLSPAEIEAFRSRLSMVIGLGVYPAPSGGRAYPWPPI